MNKLLLIRTQLLTRLENLVSAVCDREVPISRMSTTSINGKRISKLNSNNTLATKYEITCCDLLPSLKECKYITNNKEGDIFIKHVKVVDGVIDSKENKTRIKIGKLLRAITGSFLSDVEIEQITTEWKKLHTVDLDKVQITDDIKSVYSIIHTSSGDLGGSCMRHQGEKMRIYEDLNCSVAYIMERGLLVARALIWNDVIDKHSGEELTLHDRIFSSAEIHKITLKSYFEENNIEFVNEYDVHTKGNVKGTFYDDYLPYIDNMYSLDDDYRLNNYGDDSYGILQQTDGTYQFNGGREIGDTNTSTCGCCGDSCHEDDMYYVDDYGHVCGSCVADVYYCVDNDHYCYDRDNVYYAVDTGSYYYYNDDLHYLEQTDDYYYDEDAYLEAIKELKD